MMEVHVVGRRALGIGVAVLSLVLLTQCTPSPAPGPPVATGTTHAPAPSEPPIDTVPEPDPSEPRGRGEPSPEASSSAPGETDVLAGWSLEQKVGQLFMVGFNVSHPEAESYSAVRDLEVGNAFLAGRGTAGAGPIKKIVARIDAAAKDHAHDEPMFIATDQEGGSVQVLQGPGFSDIPSAMAQATLSAAQLEEQAAMWGRELADVGVNLNLAPVMDTVSDASAARTNAPIGAFKRNYGYGTKKVASHANAFSAGMESAGVDVSIKHFPGLGHVTGNTDTSADVTDRVTTRSSAEIGVFASGIDAGAAFVMVSSAYYSHLDAKSPAVFSADIISGLLREDLGFEGVVMTDDVGSAVQLKQWTPVQRAVEFLAAGGDMILVANTTSIVPGMVAGVIERAQADPVFAAQVDRAVVRVLAAKTKLGAES